MPVPPGTYVPGNPLSPQQLNTDLYSYDGSVFGANGIAWHSRRPVLAEVLQSAANYTQIPFALQNWTVADPASVNFSVIDTSALYGAGCDFPGSAATYQFRPSATASGGSPQVAGGAGGWFWSWGFPAISPDTNAFGTSSVGASMNLKAGTAASSLFNQGVLQASSQAHFSTPWYLDLLSVGSPSNTWQPGFLTWENATLGGTVTLGVTSDTSGFATRMGWAWQGVRVGGGTVAAVPSVPSAWGTVTVPMLSAAVTQACTLLNSPPMLRIAAGLTQSLPSGVNTAVAFGTAVPGLDSYSGWSSGGYAVQLPGLYLASTSVPFGTGASSTGICQSILSVNGTLHAGGRFWAGSPAGVCAGQVKVLDLQPGDIVQLYGTQTTGSPVPLAGGTFNTRMIMGWLCPAAAAGSPSLSWTPPPPGFRWQAGMASGTALTALLNARIGNDVSFILNKPYFTGYQASAQSGLSTSGAQKIIIDTPGGLIHGSSGDNYGGWSASNHWYAAPVPGWYLAVFEGFLAPPAAATGYASAGLVIPSSGGIAPVSSPDNYSQVFYPFTSGPPSVVAIGLYYLLAGEHIHPVASVQDWGASTFGTVVANSGPLRINSQFTVIWISE